MYLMRSVASGGVTLNLVKVLRGNVFIVCSNKMTDPSLGSCYIERFACQHRSLSSMSSTVDSPPPVLKTAQPKTATSPKIQKISKAMKAYLERARVHEEFISQKDVEFEIGKRHLANMMGVDVETLTQENIDTAIQYLMPSGLYSRRARPMMKPPNVMYPKEKAAQFDPSGRPYNCFFYTRYCNFYVTMHEIVQKFNELDEFEDKMLRRGISEPPEESQLYIGGSVWLTVDESKRLFVEDIPESCYKFFIETLNRLCAHPYSFRCKDFIFQFRRILSEVSQLETVPELIQDETTGRLYITADSRRKSAACKVTVWGNGEGKIRINDLDISYFPSLQDREQIMFPLQFSGLLGQVDIEATVAGSGHSAQAGAIRHALSLCVRSFITPEESERMRLAGLLTRDKRRHERKKPGQKGARAKFTWVKR